MGADGTVQWISTSLDKFNLRCKLVFLNRCLLLTYPLATQYDTKNSYPEPMEGIARDIMASRLVSITAAKPVPDPKRVVQGGIHILDLPVDILEIICRYLDICTSTCLGLTCKPFFNITEHLHPFHVSLYTRTLPSRKCLGQLLTVWMAPKYAFNHSWGKFLLKRHYVKDEGEIERRWREKETWPRIRLTIDNMGAVVAYRAKRKGFEELRYR